MISVKQQIAAILCCTFLLPNTAHAQWPVFDFMESVPLFKQLTSTTKSLNNITSQFTQLKETLESIGDKVSNITQFAQDLSGLNDNIKEFPKSITTAVNETTNISNTVENKVSEAIASVTKGQQILVNHAIAYTNNNLDRSLSENENSLKTDRKEIKLSLLDLSLWVEEEEEEEEISDAKEKILRMLAESRKESEQLTKELNDTIEDAVYILNKSADTSHKKLVELQDILLNKNLKVDEEQRESAKEKLAELIRQEQRVSDMGAEIASNAQIKYNKEYQKKLVDGYSNYEKVIQAYFTGNATKDEVEESGKRLKIQSATINAIPDKKVLQSYEDELQIIRDKTMELASDIQKMAEEANEADI